MQPESSKVETGLEQPVYGTGVQMTTTCLQEVRNVLGVQRTAGPDYLCVPLMLQVHLCMVGITCEVPCGIVF